MSRPFLTARWEHLCLLTYAVAPVLLEKRLPRGLELDTRDGRVFVSLVAFNFLDTRVLGVGWPGYRNFPELNLRFYVRQGERRGVMFIREFVPQRLTCWLARLFYNEPYESAGLCHTIAETDEAVTAECQLKYAGRMHSLTVVGRKPGIRPTAESVEHFFKEHEWGFGRDRFGRALCYQVQHSHWDVYPVAEHRLDFDFGAVYGQEWAFLKHEQPYSVVLAAGSAVAVLPKGRM